MAKEMELDRAPIKFQTFYFFHVLVVPPIGHFLVFLKICYYYRGKGEGLVTIECK